MRTALKVGLGATLAAVVAGALGFAPLVRSKAAERAERLGAELTIGAVRPGWGVVRLRDVTLRLPDVPAATVRVDLVEVDVDAGLDVEAVVVRGGSVVLEGTAEEVASQIASWRAKRAPGSGGGGGAALRADGIYVKWDGVLTDGEPVHLWGASYERSAEGDRIGADLARAAWKGSGFELRGAAVELHREGGRRVLRKLSAEGADVDIRLGGAPVASLLGSGQGERGGDGPTPTAGEKRADEDGPPRPSRGERLRGAFTTLSQAITLALPPKGEVDLAGLRARLRHGDQTLNIGPGRLRVSRDTERASLHLVPGGAEQRAPLTLELGVPLGDGPVEIDLEGGPVTLASLGVQDGDFGLTAVDRATLEARLDATLAADGSSVTFSSSGQLAELSIAQDWLARETVRGLDLGWRARGKTDLDLRDVHIHEGEFELGKVRVRAKGRVERKDGEIAARLEGGIPLASCQAMLDSIPEGLAPLLRGMSMSGTFALDGKIEFDTRRLAKMKIASDVVNECRITAVPPPIDPARFGKSFVREVIGADGKPVPLPGGPGTVGWTPRTAISRHMETAVLICEDGRFFRHRGFDEEAVHNSIRENIKARRFVRGASTISMQLAKNLYLKREKTLSRKLQEVVLTQLLEQELDKVDMMELYLNVIEYGPGVYGIGAAAAHYFNSAPGNLSLGQALYMASILPNPKVQHFAAGGAVTPGWSNYLRKLMRIAVKIRRITEEELEDALSEQVTFGAPYSPRLERDDEAAEVADGDGARFGDDEALLPDPTMPPAAPFDG